MNTKTVGLAFVAAAVVVLFSVEVYQIADATHTCFVECLSVERLTESPVTAEQNGDFTWQFHVYSGTNDDNCTEGELQWTMGQSGSSKNVDLDSITPNGVSILGDGETFLATVEADLSDNGDCGFHEIIVINYPSSPLATQNVSIGVLCNDVHEPCGETEVECEE